MTEFLVRCFVASPEDTGSTKTRTAYGLLSGGVGICVNLILFAVKFLIGLFSGAVSVMADAVNNLSDAASSIISFVGVKLAEKPADEEHPFGHGRIEYISAFIVAFLVLQMGLVLFKTSVEKVLHPEALSVSPIVLFLLCLSVCGKLWLAAFNEKLGRRIASKVMLATAADARSDVLATSATVFSLLVFGLFGKNIDGWIGILVSAFVLKAGFEIAKDTLEPIIGEKQDPELCLRVNEFVKRYEGVLGTHDLIVHSYGPSRYYASIHVELCNRMSLDEAHVLLDQIEKDAAKEMQMLLVTHADPIELHDERTNRVREIVREAVSAERREEISFHDVRLVPAAGGTNVVFDLVVPWCCREEECKEMIGHIKRKIRETDGSLNCVITIEHSYGA